MIEKTYQPSTVEGRIYAAWEEAGAFRAGRPERRNAEPYCIVIPPPNVTGSLHMGHALNNTLQDVLARFERMRGRDVLWQPGTDHAGIATQMVVDRQLMERQQHDRRALGREKFLEKVWAWKAESGGTIVNQLKRLGASCDWSRERFTMDEGLSRAVVKVFVQLHHEGLIYKDKRLVNWDPKLLTAISDLEVQQVEVKGHLWHIRYPLDGATLDSNDPSTFITVATTRPETMLGDVAVAVHPDDERYRHLVGRHAILPLVGRRIPIIADEYSDPEKGTGAVKITPAHDFNDFEVGRRHDLPLINVLDVEAKLSLAGNEAFLDGVARSPELEETLAYHARDRFFVRKDIVRRLEAAGLLAKAEPHTHTVPHGDRSAAVLEPFLTDQWYVNAKALAVRAIDAVRAGRTVFVPKSWEKTYFDWMENIQPWCISRQLWWGHQIPAWYGPDGKVFVAESEDEAVSRALAFYAETGAITPHQAREMALHPEKRAPFLLRDEDVLDTWFSSALWPFSTLGWPDETPELERYYPTDAVVTSFDIIFFWVARMLMMGLHFMEDVPFRTVYIHALVRDERGAKMSKSKGNVVDPIPMIDHYGADALRFTLAAMAAQGRDIKLSTQRVEGSRNFATKLWNACRFAEINHCVTVPDFDPKSARETLNRWIAHETGKAQHEITEAIEAYKFNEAAGAAYRFVWNIFCDWYLELAKPVLQGADGSARDETRAMTAWVRDQILKLLHPFTPFVTEELWRVTAEGGPAREGLLALAAWPRHDALAAPEAEAEIGWVIDLVTAIRSVRAEMNVAAEIPVVLVAASAATAARARRWADIIRRLARLSDISLADAAPRGAVQLVVRGEIAALPLAGVIDFAAEKARLEKEMARVKSDIARVDAKLANADFVARAPEEVVEGEREKRAEAETHRRKIDEALERLKRATNRIPPEISGGGGFTFEDVAVAIYLGALLGEESAPGLEGRVLTRVAVQRAAFGEPLDDLIVDGVAPDATDGRLSLQVKSSLIISGAATNTDFREIVNRAWSTLAKGDFREDIDRVGAITGTVSDASRRALQEVCEWARASLTADSFLARFQPGVAGEARRGILETFRQILSEHPDGKVGDADIYRLLRHFVLIRIDALHEGATDEAHAIERLCAHLLDPSQADALWSRLLAVARRSAGRSGEFDRTFLMNALRGSVRLAGAPSLRQDFERIREETNHALATIVSEINGVEIPRPKLTQQVTQTLEAHRFVNIVGLPGTGKSAVLRACAQQEQQKGPVLVLKSDRLNGASWAAHVRALGLTATAIETLLCEISATGSSVLFIDGIDRVEIPNRGILLDVLNTLLRSPSLAHWKVVATSRDNGIEPLRTWLPADWFREGGVATVVVEPFDESEARALAEAKPALRPILFGAERVREVARRPFFAAVLAQTLSRLDSSGQPVPQSETELIEVWWARGGYNSDDARIAHRQRAMIRFAKAGAATLGRRIRLDDIDLDAAGELKQDNIIKDVRVGHTIQFAHDIFFEWAFLHLLLDRDDSWLEEIRSVGEPPVLGRVVELLSQAKFTRAEDWEGNLAMLQASPVRPQWTRAWLIAPFGAGTFWDHAATFTQAVLKDDERRLAKLLVWFQAEKTRANPMVLSGQLSSGDLARREIVRIADALAWPSDIPSWSRFCGWLLLNIEQLNVDIIPDAVSVFEVWQNMFAGIPNDISAQIVATAAKWLEDIEDRHHPERFQYNPGRWSSLRQGDIGELEERLRILLLRAAAIEQQRVQDYLTRVRGRQRLRRQAFKQIAMFAPTLSVHHAKELVAVTLAELKDELPARVAARPIRSGVFPHSFSYHDWQHLAIHDDLQCFYPPSPLREPFASLFKNAPLEALALVREITNHAITAWRQLFNFDRESSGTPLPLTLTFPWGEQEFWGTGRVYLWPRGHWAPNPVACGLMALEHWAFADVEAGRPVDDVIRDVLTGHQSCAVLSIAVAVMLDARRVSRTTLPLVASHKIWKWDIARNGSEPQVDSSLIGFTKTSDRVHREAVDSSNKRLSRQIDVRWLAQLFVINSDEQLREPAQDAIKAFSANLPFEFEEEKQDEAAVASLRRMGEIWCEIGKLENYRAFPSEDGSGTYITVENPTATDPDVVAVVERSARMNEQIKLLNWAVDSLKKSKISDRLALPEALQTAKRIDRGELFDEPHGDVNDASMDRSAVASVAAVALLYGGKLDDTALAWAKDVVLRAAKTPEKRDELWHPSSKSIFHPCLYAVTGLEGLIRRGVDVQEAAPALLRLGGHPREEVSGKAIGAALSLWETNTKLSWSALNLGIRLSIDSRKARPFGFSDDRGTGTARVKAAVEKAIQELESDKPCTSLQAIPAPWVFAPRPPRDDTFDEDNPPSREPVWRDPDEFLRWEFLPNVLAHIPVPLVMADDLHRPAFLSFCYDLLTWTNERLSPSWRDSDNEGREHRSTELSEWRRHLCWLLAKVALILDPQEVQERILDPIFAHEDETAASLINPFSDIVAAGGIIDPPTVSDNAVTYMQACVQRILRDRVWEHARHRDGRLYGFDIPEIVRIFLFATGVQAGGAARFANGDWTDVEVVLPIVDPFVRAVGDVPHVISSFLTLCEQAVEHYPADIFAVQIGAVLEKQDGTPIGWRGTVIPARIAALIYALAERSHPLHPSVAQAMLRVLDKLVDMGDRRSAALQLSEIFKDVRL